MTATKCYVDLQLSMGYQVGPGRASPRGQLCQGCGLVHGSERRRKVSKGQKGAPGERSWRQAKGGSS